VNYDEKKLEIIFLSVIVIAVMVLAKNYYDIYRYKNDNIPDKHKQLIISKEKEHFRVLEKIK